MPRIDDTSNILSYFHESRAHKGRDFFHPSHVLNTPPAGRWPVRNRQERDPIEPIKRALIHARDGHTCKHCGLTARTGFVLDHIIPRSTFSAAQLAIADRSDNLVTSCWDCNEDKSNYEDHLNKRPGVTPACWDCLNPWAEDDLGPIDRDEIPARPYAAYCGRCGTTGRVPDLTWIL